MTYYSLCVGEAVYIMQRPCLFWFNKETEGGKELIFYLTTLSTHFIYGYMAPDIW